MKLFFNALMLCAFVSVSAQTNDENNNPWTSGRPDGHAPITVMGDHTHHKGEIMLSYRYMYMNMDELNRDSDNTTFADALSQYFVTPTQMPMHMHMLGAMYAPSDRLTLLVMANYLSNEMDHLTRMGGTFTTESSGFGDTKIGALYKIFNKNRQQLHAELSAVIPTGSIDEEDVIPASAPNEVILPYPMQLGSGSFGTQLGLTYLKQWTNFSFGSQAKALFYFGENDNVYRLGNRYALNNWAAYKATDWLSFSTRIELGAVDRINGANPALNPNMVITADTANSGKTYADAAIGFNLYGNKGALKDFRLGFEAGLPLFQNMNGIQLRNKEMITVGLQYAFH